MGGASFRRSLQNRVNSYNSIVTKIPYSFTPTSRGRRTIEEWRVNERPVRIKRKNIVPLNGHVASAEAREGKNREARSKP
jgi:hypothetical protein